MPCIVQSALVHLPVLVDLMNLLWQTRLTRFHWAVKLQRSFTCVFAWSKSPCSDYSFIVSLSTNQIAELIWFLSPGWRTLSMMPAMASATTETLATVQWVAALVSGVQTESRTKKTVQETNMTWLTPIQNGHRYLSPLMPALILRFLDLTCPEDTSVQCTWGHMDFRPSFVNGHSLKEFKCRDFMRAV